MIARRPVAVHRTIEGDAKVWVDAALDAAPAGSFDLSPSPASADGYLLSPPPSGAAADDLWRRIREGAFAVLFLDANSAPAARDFLRRSGIDALAKQTLEPIDSGEKSFSPALEGESEITAFLKKSPDLSLATVRVTSVLDFSPSGDGVTAPLSVSTAKGKQAFLALAQAGEGRIAIFNSPADRSAGNFVASPFFVPLLYETLGWLAGDPSAGLSVPCGDLAALPLPAGVDITEVDGPEGPVSRDAGGDGERSVCGVHAESAGVLQRGGEDAGGERAGVGGGDEARGEGRDRARVFGKGRFRRDGARGGRGRSEGRGGFADAPSRGGGDAASGDAFRLSHEEIRMTAVVYFEPMLAPWALLFGAIVAAGAAFLYYRGREGELSKGRRAALLGLRLAGFAFVLLVLAGPVSRTEETIRRGRPLTILLDTSGSMATEDAGGKARFVAARDAIVEAAAKLGREYDLRVYSFDRKPEFLGSAASAGDAEVALEGASPKGAATALGEAIVDAAPRGRGGAEIVLSDGASNSGRAVSDAAQALSVRGVKVFAVPFGKAGRPNVAVRRVLGPRLLLKHEPSAFFAEVVFTGAATGGSKVVLKQGEKIVATAEAEASAAPALVRLNFTPDGEGDITYTVEAAAFPTEENTADNRVERTVSIAKEKLKVLYVEEAPRWEYRFLKNAIVRDERLAPKMLLREADKEAAAAEYQVTKFPESRAEVFAFDVVVIGDVNPDFFLPKDIENLRAFVSEGGGGVLFIAGAAFDPLKYGARGIGELLPADASRTAAVPQGGFALTLTEAGVDNPALSLSTEEQAAFWKTLPRVYWMLDMKPRAAGTVLAKTVPGDLAAIVEQPFGRGRTMIIGTDELWRWRRERGDRYLYRLWAQLVRYLGQRRLVAGAAAGELVLAADNVALGQDVSATAYLEDTLGMPLAEPSVAGILEAPDGARTDLLFSRAAEGAGLYRVEFPVSSPGKHTLCGQGADRVSVGDV